MSVYKVGKRNYVSSHGSVCQREDINRRALVYMVYGEHVRLVRACECED